MRNSVTILVRAVQAEGETGTDESAQHNCWDSEERPSPHRFQESQNLSPRDLQYGPPGVSQPAANSDLGIFLSKEISSKKEHYWSY